MLSKAGLNGDSTIDQLRAAFPNPDSDEIVAIVSLIHQRPNKFSPKLSFTQRCEVLVLHRSGFTREIIAKMYGIDRRTVTHVCTDNSPHYKNVRQEEIGLGRARFEEKYRTPDLLNRAYAYVEANKQDGPVNNKQATAKAGIHSMRGELCTFNHRVIIKWLEPPEGDVRIAGWYYRDLDGDYSDMWFTRGEPDMKTSQACYNAALEEIADKLK
jgi:hypothetical protein